MFFLSKALRAEGYGLVISSSDEDPETERQEIGQMIRTRVDALLLSSCQGNPDSLIRLAEQKIPYILVDRNFQRHKSNFVGTDDVLVGELATEHLIKIGRRRIAHIGGGQAVSTSVDRLQGYRKTLERHKLRIPSEYVVARTLGDESGDITGREAMEKLMRLKPRPDAVFCYNDPAAIGAINATLNAGLRVPEDVAIVGAGNIRYADSFRVPLTSVDVSSHRLGESAGVLALKIMTAGKAPTAKTIIVPPKLMVRQSTVGK
jgi:LacI family transcriptional regulator